MYKMRLLEAVKMSELIVLIGSGGSGKTFLAQKISKEQGYTYLDHDRNYIYLPKEGKDAKLSALQNFLNWLAKIVNSSPERNFVLDGYILFYDHFLKKLKPLIKHHEIKVKILFTSIETIIERRKRMPGNKNVPLPLSIFAIYSGIGRLIDWTKCELLNTTTFETIESYHQLMLALKNPVSHKVVEDFVASLVGKKYDKFYQAIELPFGIEVKGYSPTKASWGIVSSLVSFKGKSVVDIGCFHGYHLFKAEELGAKSMLGLDQHPGVVETVRQIAFLKSSFAEFRLFDVDNGIVPEKDVGMALNVLYHAKKPYEAFKKLLCCKEVVIETKLDRQALLNLAEQKGHKLVAERQSPRGDRKIMVFGSG